MPEAFQRHPGGQAIDGSMSLVADAPSSPRARAFPALHHPDYRSYAWSVALAMAGDNVEHVIGYWLIWEISQSPFWLGYAVFTHWIPFILFSAVAGTLADRLDSRLVIQVSQALYMSCSLAWGVLALTGRLELWHVAVILVVHGLAGVVFGPSSMLIIHEMVGPRDLVSAISLNAASRNLALMVGPIVGGALLASVGPGTGFLINILIYLPLSVVLFKLPYKGIVAASTRGEGWRGYLAGFRAVRRSRLILGLLCVGGVGSFLVGSAFQAMMPVFAVEVLGVREFGYSLLLSSFGLGSVIGAVILGLQGSVLPRPALVTASALTWSLCVGAFALSRWFPLSVALLLGAGASMMLFSSMGQTIIQTWSPPALRGRVVGLYSMISMGPRAFSGLLVGGFATASGAPAALATFSALIVIVTLGMGALVREIWGLAPIRPAEEPHP